MRVQNEPKKPAGWRAFCRNGWELVFRSGRGGVYLCGPRRGRRCRAVLRLRSGTRLLDLRLRSRLLHLKTGLFDR